MSNLAKVLQLICIFLLVLQGEIKQNTFSLPPPPMVYEKCKLFSIYLLYLLFYKPYINKKKKKLAERAKNPHCKIFLKK